MEPTLGESQAASFTATFKEWILYALDQVQSMDHFLLNKINTDWTSAWADQFFPWVTDLHKHPVFFVVAPVLIALVFAKKFKLQTISLMVVLTLCLAWSDYSGGKVKRVIERPRPFQYKELSVQQLSPAGQNNSFYSNHATNNFALAAFVAFFMPMLSWLFFTIAFTVAYSRIYNGVHFPTDVFVGAAMGMLWGNCFGSLGSRLLTKNLRDQLQTEKKSARKNRAA